MTQIIKEYGQAIVAAVSAVMIITLLAVLFLSDRGGLRKMTDSFISRYIGDNFRGGGELAMAMGRSLDTETGDLEIKKTLRKDIGYDVCDILTVSGSDVKEARVISVTGRDGFDVTELVYTDDRLKFYEEGVYRLRVCVWNDKGVRSMRKLFLGVAG